MILTCKGKENKKKINKNVFETIKFFFFQVIQYLEFYSTWLNTNMVETILWKH